LYDIYLLQLGFHPVAVAGKLVKKKKRQLYTKGETIHKTIQKHRIQKTENIQNKKTNIQRTLKQKV